LATETTTAAEFYTTRKQRTIDAFTSNAVTLPAKFIHIVHSLILQIIEFESYNVWRGWRQGWQLSLHHSQKLGRRLPKSLPLSLAKKSVFLSKALHTLNQILAKLWASRQIEAMAFFVCSFKNLVKREEICAIKFA